MIDLVLSQYGGYTVDRIYDELTPGQLILLAEKIVERREQDVVEQASIMRIAFGASSEQFSQFVQEFQEIDQIKVDVDQIMGRKKEQPGVARKRMSIEEVRKVRNK